MLLAMKDEAGSNLSNEENDFMLDTSYGEDLEELTAAVMYMLVSKVRILQKSQENGQNRTNTDTGKEREYKSRENAIKGQQKSTLGQH
ncbi:hypothetical protein Tco_1456557 [Tanacetum coccineum]